MTRNEARELLKVGPSASSEDIRRAYKSEAQKFHPDLHQSQPQHVLEVLAERFRRLTEARDTLLDQGEPDEDPHDRELAAEVERVGELHRQRRFDEALSLLAAIAARRPNRDNLDLQMIRFRILSDADRDQEAVLELYQMLAANPDLRNDLSFLESLAIHELASGQAQAALQTIDQCERVAGQNIPIYVALKAQALVSAGRVAEADLAIDHLKKIDPSHPLIKERQSVARVGNNYVQKNDAASAGCILCVLLECIFDCI